MSSLFLLRPASQKGESLSSWRQRVGWANGYRLFALQSGTLRRSDPDLGLHESEFEWISATHGGGIAQARDMTFRSLSGVVASSVESRRHAQWWLPARYGRSDALVGAMFCPACLAQDEVPYFRLAWRLGFNVVCPRHGVEYFDHCRECGCRPWPAGCSGVQQISEAFSSMDKCWRCGARLSRQLAAPSEKLLEFDRWLSSGHATLSGHTVPALEMFTGLRAMCQLFLRTRTREMLLSTGYWPDLERALQGQSDVPNVVERLCVEVRHTLLRAALGMLQNWPTNFLRAVNQAGITRAHFNGCEQLNPSWLQSVIDTAMARQNRWIREDDVRRVVMELRNEGHRVTKAEIWRRLDWWGDIDPSWLT